MIIPLEILLIAVLGLAGWFQNRWLFLLFATGEIFLIVEFIVAVVSAAKTQVRMHSYSGAARIGRIPHVRVSVDSGLANGNRICVKARLTLPSGAVKKLKYKAFVTESALSLPVPALSVGEETLTIKSISFSDAAGIFFFRKKINASVIIPVIPDPEKSQHTVSDESEKSLLERQIIIEKGSEFSRDEIRAFREYRIGDERRDIHWNISARLGRYYVKEYEGSDTEHDAGDLRKNGRVSDDEKKTPLSDIKQIKDTLKKQIKALGKVRDDTTDTFVAVIRGVITAGIVLAFMLQMTLFGKPFTFDAGAVIICTVAMAAVLTLGEMTKKLTLAVIPIVAAVIAFVERDSLVKSVKAFVSWLAGTYKYANSSPDVSLTVMLLVISIVMTLLIWLLSHFRIFPMVVTSGAASVYLAKNTFKVTDQRPLTSVALCIAAAAAFIIPTLISRQKVKKLYALASGNDRGYIVNIVVGGLSIVLGISVSGIVPQLISSDALDRISDDRVLSGQFADASLSNVYNRENDIINAVIRSPELHYRVPFDGRVGQQASQQTGETQLVVRADKKPAESLYIRFFTGRKYKNAEWYGGESDVLIRKAFEDSAQKMGEAGDDVWGDISSASTEMMREILQFSATRLQYEEREKMTGNESPEDFLQEYQIANAQVKEKHGRNFYYRLGDTSVPLSVRDFYDASDEMQGPGPANTTVGIGVIQKKDCYEDVSDIWDDAKEKGFSYRKGEADDEALYPDRTTYRALLYALVDAYGDNYGKYYMDVPYEGIDQIRQLVKDKPLTDEKEITAYIRYILASHASYSIKVRDPAGDVDPIEYFLFTSHRGHCEYYSSAACLLYRLYGIPARYVSGYRLDASDFKKNGNSWKAEVSDKKAHAWVEIYHTSTGWIPVEMTPAEVSWNADDSVTGYPTDRSEVIWPGFTEGNLQDIQKKNGWTGRTFNKKTTEQSTTQTKTQVNTEQKATTQTAKTDTSNKKTPAAVEEKKPIAEFVEANRTVTVLIVIAVILFIGLLIARRIAEYRFRHGGLLSIAKKTDRLIERSRNFAIYMEPQQERELTGFFRLLDRARYAGYSGNAEEVKSAYLHYDEIRGMICGNCGFRKRRLFFK